MKYLNLFPIKKVKIFSQQLQTAERDGTATKSESLKLIIKKK